MAEAKPLASLSSGLLARKGAARPAMRRQGLSGSLGHAVSQDDLGWNDMGYDVEPDTHVNVTSMLTPASIDERDIDEYDGEESEAGQTGTDEYAQSPVRPVADEAEFEAEKPAVVLQRERLAEELESPADPLDSKPRKKVMALQRGFDDEEPVIDGDDELPAFESADEAVSASGDPQDFASEADFVSPEQDVFEPAPAVQETTAFEAPVARPVPARTPRAANAKRAKAAFTLRIDPERHLRLRLASAMTNCSAQQLLTEAFDKYLQSLPEVEALVSNIGDREAAK